MVSNINKELYLLDGYLGRYTITRDGEVYSKKGLGKWKKLKPYMIAGYPAVGLMKNKVRTITHIHRLLAMTFIPNPLKKPCVNHKDGNKLNNDLSNLEWVTYKENSAHSFKTGLNMNHGENHQFSKVTSEIAKSIYILKNKISQRDLSRMFKLSVQTIQSIQSRRSWKMATENIIAPS